MDERSLSDAWSAMAFRGILTILFGIAAVFWPGLTLTTFVYLFGGFVLASGLVTLVMALANIYSESKSALSRILAVIVGIAEIGVGVYLLRHIAVSFATLILVVGFVLIFRGLVDIFTGLFEEEGSMHKTVMVIGGLLSGLVGVILLFQPVSGGVAFVWVLGLYALITGPLLIALALDMKNSGTKKLRRS